MNPYEQAIHNLLVQTARAHSFTAANYEVVAVGAQRALSVETLTPSSVKAWQEAKTFVEPANYRRDGSRREEAAWSWRLRVQFDRDVSLASFEDLLQSGLRIPRNTAEGRPRQVDILLEDAEYQSPVTQEPSQGLRVTYRFTAQLTPI